MKAWARVRRFIALIKLKMKSYKSLMADLVELIPQLENEIFDYEDDPLKEELDIFFKFYQETLIKHYEYGTEPSYLFIGPNRWANARATKHDGVYLVQINVGTFEWLKEMSQRAGEYLSPEIESFIDQLDTSIESLIHDFALHYTFYHEQAHLIQKSDLLDTGLMEEPEIIDDFSMERHILELDADEFSSLNLGGHVLTYFDKILPEPPSQKQVEDLLVLACSSVMLYFMSFKTNRIPLYFYESTHPHPTLRNTRVILTIVGYTLETLKKKGIEIALNPGDILRRSSSAIAIVAEDILDDNLVGAFWSNLGQDPDQVLNYEREFRQAKEGRGDLSIFKWNQLNP